MAMRGVWGLILLIPLAVQAAGPSACDSPEFQAVLQPSAAIEARAYWLNRRLIQWP